MMTAPRSSFLREAVARGFLHQCTDLESLDAEAMKGPVVAYIGFDATADSLHVGSLVSIMLLRLLQRTGHKPIVLMGGGTTKIGDPSFRDETRKLLGDAEIARNIAGIRKVFTSFLRFGAIASIGVLAALLLSFTLLPVLLVRIPLDAVGAGRISTSWDRALQLIVRISDRRGTTILTVVGGLLLVCGVGVARLEVDVDERQLFGENNLVVQWAEFVEENLRRSDTLEIDRSDHGGSVNLWYRFTLTMLTADGISVEVEKEIFPKVVSHVVTTDPFDTGITQVTVSNVIRFVPYGFPTIVGSEIPVKAPAVLFFKDGVYSFNSWSPQPGSDPFILFVSPEEETVLTAAYDFIGAVQKIWMPFVFTDG